VKTGLWELDKIFPFLPSFYQAGPGDGKGEGRKPRRHRGRLAGISRRPDRCIMRHNSYFASTIFIFYNPLYYLELWLK
jgi:hypothetical protein